MGSRGRSIRLRIYFLVAIPLIAMVGLLAYVASTTVNNAINLDRAPNLINATSLPTAEFINLLQNERAAAVIYLFQPTPENQAAYAAAVKATQAGQPKFIAAMNSPGTKSSQDAAEADAIKAIVGGLNQLPQIRGGVTNRAITPLVALGGYNGVILNEPAAVPGRGEQPDQRRRGGQALGLIATVSGQGGAVPGVRPAVRDDGRAADDPGRPGRVRRDGRHPAGRHPGRRVRVQPGQPGRLQPADQPGPAPCRAS